MSLASLMWLLPVFFMLHDFEELIMFRPWLRRTGGHVRARFPALAARALPHLERLSTSAFSLAVAEEFVLLAAFTWAAVEFRWHAPWAGLLIAFFLHLVIHLVQWAALRRYVPVFFTSLLAAPYCVYALAYLLRGGFVTWAQALLWAAIFAVILVVNVLFAHKLAARFQAWLDHYAPA